MESLPPRLAQILVDTALKGAYVANRRRYEEGTPKLYEKLDADGQQSVLTKGDWQAEQVMRAAIQEVSPELLQHFGHRYKTIELLTEESGHNFAARNKGLTVVIDPIDGTRGYSKQNPGAPWAVSIALEENGKPVAAAVYEAAPSEYSDEGSSNPDKGLKGKIYWAQKEKGAHIIHPSNDGFMPDVDRKWQEIPSKDQIPELLDIPYIKVDYAAGTSESLNKFRTISSESEAQLGDFLSDRKKGLFDDGPAAIRVQHRVTEMRRLMPRRCLSTVCGGIMAADGRAPAFMHGSAFPWDTAAIRLILEESGTPVVEYSLPDDPKRSLLVAGRDIELFDAMRGEAEDMKMTKDVIMAANLARTGAARLDTTSHTTSYRH